MEPNAYGVVRVFLGTATWGSLALGFVTRDVRWFIVSGALGTIWWLADFLWNRLLVPLGDFLAGMMRGEVALPPANLRPSLDETVRLLERHIEGKAARHVQIQAALRLADLYRAAYQDPERAKAIIQLVKTRFPDAEELESADRL